MKHDQICCIKSESIFLPGILCQNDSPSSMSYTEKSNYFLIVNCLLVISVLTWTTSSIHISSSLNPNKSTYWNYGVTVLSIGTTQNPCICLLFILCINTKYPSWKQKCNDIVMMWQNVFVIKFPKKVWHPITFSFCYIWVMWWSCATPHNMWLLIFSF